MDKFCEQNKVLVLGKTGQLASSFHKIFGQENMEFLSREDLDLSDLDSLEKLNSKDFDILINTTAYTQVDKAESEKDLCNTINHLAVEKLAQICKSKNALFAHYSTDYVFDQPKDNTSYLKEDASTFAINHYGQSKLDGELAIKKVGCEYLIFRTSWVFSEFGNNFVKTMLRLANDKDSLNVVSDQWGKPTFASDLAKSSFAAISLKKSSMIESGIYHIANNTKTNWAEFASTIISMGSEMGLCKKIPVHGIPTSNYPTPAKRPLNNILDCAKIEETLSVKLPSWDISLKKCLEELAKN